MDPGPVPAESNPNQLGEIPIELTGRTPRRVRITGTGWLNVFAAVLFSLIGVAVSVVIVKQVMHTKAERDALRQGGRDVVGQLNDKWHQGRSNVPYIGYTFPVDGTFYTGKSEAPGDTWRSLRQYDSLAIRYLPANPNINHPAAWEDAPYSALGGLFPAAFFVVFGWMFVRRFPVQRRLATEGTAVKGSITECTGPGRNGNFGLSYTFRNASGNQEESGRCLYDSSRKVGSGVWVLYLPSDPSRSEVYPFGIPFYRVEQ
jgi:hypothetical protein